MAGGLAKSRRRRQRRSAAGLGISGSACLIYALISLVQAPDAERELADSSAHVDAGEPATQVTRSTDHDFESSYYPLEVGRYWVYRHEDPRTGVITEVERFIERSEKQADVELFHFSDGMVAYEKTGMVFEIGTGGGVNVVPIKATNEPYAYRT